VTTPSALDRPIALAELVEAAALDEVIRSYADFHGVEMEVVDAQGNVLCHAGKPAELCEAVRDRPAGAVRCDARRREARQPRPTPRCDCFCGLRYRSTPLVHEGTLLGAVVVGPYRPDDQPTALTGAVQTLLGPGGLAEGEAALSRLHTIADAQAQKIVAHVARVLGVLLHTAYARHLTAQLHTATMAEAYKELSDKNERLGAAVERMQEVDRLKSNFLATVSHELRTPLTSVIGYSEMLIEGLAGQLNPEQREYVQIIMEKGDHLLQLITGILDVSRMDSGPLKLAREPLQVAEMAANILSALTPLARRKRVELRLDAARPVPRVHADREKLRQVVIHLVSNAVKFTPEGGRVLVGVEVGPLAREEDLVAGGAGALGVRLRVTDSGIGIAPDKQVRIFEPFFQVDSSSTREYGGTGLGLTLVKSYVEAHGGHVWVDSELGRGSAFTVTLPLEPEAAAVFPGANA
jgi:signal transduction histidine kinase